MTSFLCNREHEPSNGSRHVNAIPFPAVQTWTINKTSFMVVVLGERINENMAEESWKVIQAQYTPPFQGTLDAVSRDDTPR